MEQMPGGRTAGMELDLRAYVRVLSKRKWTALITLLVVVGLTAMSTARQPRVYESRTTLFVGEQQVQIDEAREGIFSRNVSIGLLKSYVEIIKSRSIAQRAIVDGGLDVTPTAIMNGLDARSIIETQVIEVTFHGRDAPRAQRIANAVADAFVAEIERLGDEGGGRPAVTIDVIDRAITSGDPISPKPVTNMTVAFLVGLLLALGGIFVREQFDTSVKHREDLELMGLTVLGSIPRLDTHGEELYLERDTQGLAGEAFRKLRTSVGFINLEHPTHSILVTSASPQEGKTTTALNLAMAYALGGLRTVLVEADLRRPSLHRIFGMVGTRGLTTTIVGDCPLTEAILHTETRNLSVILAGAIPPNPVELLGSDQMAEVLDRLERMFDVVVVDSPPLGPVADPAALASKCDGVIIVTRSGKTDRRRLAEAVKVIDRAGGRLLGIVLNFLKPADAPYDYAYHYGYRSTSAQVSGSVPGGKDS